MSDSEEEEYMDWKELKARWTRDIGLDVDTFDAGLGSHVKCLYTNRV